MVTVDATLQVLNGATLEPVEVADDAASPTGRALPSVDAAARSTLVDILEASVSPFARLLKFEPLVGEEIRRDETSTDDYHGAAPDGTAATAASWKVVRFYKTAGLITRVRYRTGVVWNDRASGWT